jgi:hypothetical protein
MYAWRSSNLNIRCAKHCYKQMSLDACRSRVFTHSISGESLGCLVKCEVRVLGCATEAVHRNQPSTQNYLDFHSQSQDVGEIRKVQLGGYVHEPPARVRTSSQCSAGEDY